MDWPQIHHHRPRNRDWTGTGVNDWLVDPPVTYSDFQLLIYQGDELSLVTEEGILARSQIAISCHDWFCKRQFKLFGTTIVHSFNVPNLWTTGIYMWTMRWGGMTCKEGGYHLLGCRRDDYVVDFNELDNVDGDHSHGTIKCMRSCSRNQLVYCLFRTRTDKGSSPVVLVIPLQEIWWLLMAVIIVYWLVRSIGDLMGDGQPL